MGDQTIHSVLRLESDGDKVVGTYSNQNMEVEIENSHFKNGELHVEFSTDVQGADLFVAFDGKVERSSITGEVDLHLNDQEYNDRPWEAKRFVGAEESAGTWDLEFTSPDGVERTPKITITRDGEKISGKIAADGNEETFDTIELTDGGFNFKYTTEYQGGNLHLQYNCVPLGNHMEGTVEFDFEGNTGAIDFVGKRKALPRSAKKLLGVWDVSLTTPDGQAKTPTLELKEVDGELVVELSDSGIEFSVEDVELDGAVLTFNMQTQHDANTVDLQWSSEMDGEELTGTVTFSVGAESGDIPIEGTKR